MTGSLAGYNLLNPSGPVRLPAPGNAVSMEFRWPVSIQSELIEQLLLEDEGAALDFKRKQYPFVGASKEEKSELLKDVLAFANAFRRSDAYILVGVEEQRGARSEVVGVSTHLDDANLQQFVNSKTQAPVTFGNYIFDSPKPLKAMQPLFVHHPAPTGKNNGSNARRLSIHVLTSAPSTSHRLRLAFSCRSAVTVNADPATSMLARAWVRCTLMAFLRAPFRILGLAAFLRGAVVEYTSRERVELRVGRPGLAFLRHAVNCS